MRYWLSAALLALGGCSVSAPSGDSPMAMQSAECQAYATAWVTHFRANVAVVSSSVTPLQRQQLAEAKAHLASLAAPKNCHKPYCLIQPKAEGRLDSYCGYKVPDPTGQELYRWIDWPD